MTLFETSHEATGRRAAEFFERRRFGGWSDVDQVELDAWLAESALHRVAYLRIEGSFSHALRVVTSSTLEPKPAPPRRLIETWMPRLVLPALAAASLALFSALGLPLVSRWLEPADRTYSTDVGGRTLLSFGDHTEIELNTDTLVRYRMTNRERTVWLERGEAWFHVAHNAGVPFSVVAGRHRVTDLGTEFLVRRDADRMEVALLKGRAALSTEGAQTAALRPGDDAFATPASMSVVRKTPQELANELAWRRGVLAFRNTRLADVVREFNRYNTTKLVIADPSIAGEKISADLKTDDYEGFLGLAHAVLNLRADREGNVILISRAPKENARK